MGQVAQAAPLLAQGVTVVEVSPEELVIVGGTDLFRAPLKGAVFEARDARFCNRFVRHVWIAFLSDQRVDLVTDPRLGAIAPRAARLPEVVDPSAVIDAAHLAGLYGWLEGKRRLLGLSLEDLARLACVASVAFAIAIGERAADLATQMTWEHGSPHRSSPVTDARSLLEPFEKHAQTSERANLALMAALSQMG